MKKFAKILLPLLLVVALAGCADAVKGSRAGDLVGKWNATKETKDSFAKSYGYGINSLETYTIEFRQDNTCTVTVKGTNSTDKAFDGKCDGYWIADELNFSMWPKDAESPTDTESGAYYAYSFLRSSYGGGYLINNKNLINGPYIFTKQ